MNRRRRLALLALVALFGAGGLLSALSVMRPKNPSFPPANLVAPSCAESRPQSLGRNNSITSPDLAAGEEIPHPAVNDGKDSAGDKPSLEKMTEADNEPKGPDLLLKPSWGWNTTRESFVLRVKLRATVQDEFRRPLPDIEITVSAYGMAFIDEIPEGMSVSPARESYDAALVGRTDSSGVLEAEIGLQASFEEFGFVMFYVSAATAMAQSDKIRVDWSRGQPDKVLEADLVLPRRGGVRGRAADPAGAPVGGVGVYIYKASQPGGNPHARAFTDETGAFEVLNLAPGEYNLSARGDFYESAGDPVAVTIYENAVASLAAPLPVAPITRYMLKLNPPEGFQRPFVVALRFFSVSGEIEARETPWFSDSSVRLYRPPKDAVAVEISARGCKTLRVVLPSIVAGQVVELGDFNLPTEEE